MGLSGTAGPTPVHLLRPFSEVQLITLKTPSFPTCHPYPHPYLHYLIIIFPSFKPQNTTTIISDVNHIENTPFSNLHPYPHHHLHYIIIIFPTIKPQNTTTIISDVQLITKKTTSSTSIFRKDHPFSSHHYPTTKYNHQQFLIIF